MGPIYPGAPGTMRVPQPRSSLWRRLMLTPEQEAKFQAERAAAEAPAAVAAERRQYLSSLPGGYSGWLASFADLPGAYPLVRGAHSLVQQVPRIYHGLRGDEEPQPGEPPRGPQEVRRKANQWTAIAQSLPADHPDAAEVNRLAHNYNALADAAEQVTRHPLMLNADAEAEMARAPYAFDQHQGDELLKRLSPDAQREPVLNDPLTGRTRALQEVGGLGRGVIEAGVTAAAIDATGGALAPFLEGTTAGTRLLSFARNAGQLERTVGGFAKGAASWVPGMTLEDMLRRQAMGDQGGPGLVGHSLGEAAKSAVEMEALFGGIRGVKSLGLRAAAPLTSAVAEGVARPLERARGWASRITAPVRDRLAAPAARLAEFADKPLVRAAVPAATAGLVAANLTDDEDQAPAATAAASLGLLTMARPQLWETARRTAWGEPLERRMTGPEMTRLRTELASPDALNHMSAREIADLEQRLDDEVSRRAQNAAERRAQRGTQAASTPNRAATRQARQARTGVREPTRFEMHDNGRILNERTGELVDPHDLDLDDLRRLVAQLDDLHNQGQMTHAMRVAAHDVAEVLDLRDPHSQIRPAVQMTPEDAQIQRDLRYTSPVFGHEVEGTLSDSEKLLSRNLYNNLYNQIGIGHHYARPGAERLAAEAQESYLAKAIKLREREVAAGHDHNVRELDDLISEYRREAAEHRRKSQRAQDAVDNPEEYFTKKEQFIQSLFDKYETLYPMPDDPAVKSVIGRYDQPNYMHVVLRDPRTGKGHIHAFVARQGGPYPDPSRPDVSIMAGRNARSSRLQRGNLFEIKRHIVERWGDEWRDTPANWNHAGGLAQGTMPRMQIQKSPLRTEVEGVTHTRGYDEARRTEIWQRLIVPVIGLVASGMMSHEDAKKEITEAGFDFNHVLPMILAASAIPVEREGMTRRERLGRLGRAASGAALAAGGVALEQGSKDEDLQAFGRGAQALGAASAIWAGGRVQEMWGATGRALVEHARQTPHGEGTIRKMLQMTNPEALLDPEVQRLVRAAEDYRGQLEERGKTLGRASQRLADQYERGTRERGTAAPTREQERAALERFVADVVEGDRYLDDAQRQELQDRYGEQWPEVVKNVIRLADAVRQHSGELTEGLARASRLGGEAVERYAAPPLTEEAPGEPRSAHMERMYAGSQAREAMPAFATPARGAGEAPRVGGAPKERTLDVRLREAMDAREQARAELKQVKDDPQSTPQQIAHAQQVFDEAHAAVKEERETQRITRRGLGEVREPSYRVPKQTARAAGTIASSDLFHQLIQLNENLPPERQILHPDFVDAQQRHARARGDEAMATDVGEEATWRDVREHHDTQRQARQQELDELRGKMANEAAAGRKPSPRMMAEHQRLRAEVDDLQAKVDQARARELAATDEPALQTARAERQAAEADLKALRDQYRTKGHHNWVTLPESGFGAMSGAVVSQDLQGTLEGWNPGRGSAFSQLWDKGLRAWKRQKTIYSPGTHVGNMMSNVVASHMAGTSIAQQARLWDAAVKGLDELDRGGTGGRLSQAGQIAEMLRGKRVVGSTLEEAGVAPGERPMTPLRRVMAGAEPGSPVQQILGEVGVKPERGPGVLGQMRATAEHAYTREDDIFRVIMALDRMKQGDTMEEATDYARKQLVDYRTRSPALRGIAKSGLSPFIMYPAKAIPTFMNNVLQHPWRWTALMGGLAAANEYGQSEVGPQDEIQPTDVPPEQRSGLRVGGRDWLGMMMPGMTQIGVTGEEDTPRGRARYGINPSRWFPISSLVDRPPPEMRGYEDILGIQVPRLLQPSGPTWELATTTLGSNRDPYTGRPIIPPGASTSERLQLGGRRLARDLVSPLWGVGERVAQNIERGGSPVAVGAEAAGQMLGLRPQRIEPGRYADRRLLSLNEDRRTRLEESRRTIRGAEPNNREAVQQEELAKTEAALKSLREQALEDLELSDDERAVLARRMEREDRKALMSLRRYRPGRTRPEGLSERGMETILRRRLLEPQP